MLHGATPVETYFLSVVAHKFQLKVSTCNSGLKVLKISLETSDIT